MKPLLIYLFALLITIDITYAQCNSADFTFTDNICSDQNISIDNLSTSGQSYYWDFCSGDLNTTPSAGSYTANSILKNTYAFDVLEHQGSFYGFAITQFTKSLIRVDFGNDLTSDPTYTNLGKFGDILVNSFDIKMVSYGGNWYGFVANGTANNIIIFDFQDSPANVPTTSLINDASFDKPVGVDIYIDNNAVYGVVSNEISNEFSILSFGSTISSSPTISSFLVTGADELGEVKIVKECDNYFAFAVTTSFADRKLYKVDFGNSLTNTPSAIQTVDVGTTKFVNSTSLNIGVESGSYYAFIQIRGGNIYKLYFKEAISNTPVVTDLGTLGLATNTGGATLFNYKSSWHYFSINLGGNAIQHVNFTNSCPARNEVSSDSIPINSSYSTSGKYYISLKAIDNSGNISYHLDSINISADIAPDISFSFDNVICVNSNVQFTSSTSASGLTYTWDFGDTNSSSDPNPTHSYAAAGDYEVTLTVDDGTCGNFTKQTVTIYDEPVPDFTIPGGTICTNQDYIFTNTTPGTFGGLITYEWQLDGLSVGTDTDLSIAFNTGGTKELKLIASIPGCTVEVAKSLVDIKEGAIPSFTFDDPCVGDLVQFTNSSTGTITNYNWDFGNGFTSTLENPQIEYTSSGEFTITLELTNTDGCITNDSRAITVHPNPTVDFTNELSCENLETQFTDMSLITVDNFDSWAWDFGDGSSNILEQNPAHVFETDGSYDVKLVTTSSFGCSDSLTKTINVQPSPIADFSNNISCEDTLIQFQDNSTPINGESISSWGWNIGGTFYEIQNPQHVFNEPLTYDVSLTVTSENLCSSFINKSIIIPPKPTVTFVESDNCDNQITKLIDNTTIEGDEITDWQWYYDGNVEGNLNEQLFNFETGVYTVILEISTVNGCVYQSTQEVTVNSAPVAAFTPSFTFGAPPLEISFSNSSQGAVSYSWDFKDGNTSNEENPNNSFASIGEYDVELVVTSIDNCRDTTNAVISVLDPVDDLSLGGLSLIDIDSEEIISMAITNNGTIKYDSFKITLDFEGEFALSEKITSELNPNESMTIQLDFGLNNKRLEYLCATVSSYYDLIDSDLDDNSSCVNFTDTQVIINPPFPNPTNGLASFDVILQQSGNVNVEIIDSKGEVIDVYQQFISKGPNTLTLDMSGLKEGIYFVSISALNDQKKYRIALVD